MYLHFVLPKANVFTTWLSGNIELKKSDLLSQEQNECFAVTTSRAHIISALFAASFSERDRMDVCLELLLLLFVLLQMLFLVLNCGLEDAVDVSDL